ncbi:MAG: DUF1579 family protein [Bryobacteraceae bacterium]|nr:DUF1579 family protein [Bryobacteraceae bacterium]
MHNFEQMAGEWRGTNRLFLVWLENPEFVSDSTLRAEVTGGGKFLEVHYTWSHEGKAHEGTLLCAGDAKTGEGTAGWVDSWHSSASVMSFKGTVTPFSVKGSYSAGEGPDWYWRISLGLDGGKLRMTMENIMPDGQEMPAVVAEYERAAEMRKGAH